MILRLLVVTLVTLVQGQKDDPHGHHAHHDGDPLDWLRDSVPGEPGVDYPIFADVEESNFDCAGRVNGGKEIKNKRGTAINGYNNEDGY